MTKKQSLIEKVIMELPKGELDTFTTKAGLFKKIPMTLTPNTVPIMEL
jgi:hypothetical protein